MASHGWANRRQADTRRGKAVGTILHHKAKSSIHHMAKQRRSDGYASKATGSTPGDPLRVLLWRTGQPQGAPTAQRKSAEGILAGARERAGEGPNGARAEWTGKW